MGCVGGVEIRQRAGGKTTLERSGAQSWAQWEMKEVQAGCCDAKIKKCTGGGR